MCRAHGELVPAELIDPLHSQAWGAAQRSVSPSRCYLGVRATVDQEQDVRVTVVPHARSLTRHATILRIVPRRGNVHFAYRRAILSSLGRMPLT